MLMTDHRSPVCTGDLSKVAGARQQDVEGHWCVPVTGSRLPVHTDDRPQRTSLHCRVTAGHQCMLTTDCRSPACAGYLQNVASVRQ